MDFIDQSVLRFFINNRVEWLYFVMLIVTYSGSLLVTTGLTILSAASFYIHKHANQVLPFLISVGGTAITVFFLKNIFSRVRPLSESFYLETSFSFPSGHSALAVALYGFLLYTLWKQDKHHLKNPTIIFLFILILLIGLSRLYLGVHYLSDVLAGYAVGLIWIWIGAAISKSKILHPRDTSHL